MSDGLTGDNLDRGELLTIAEAAAMVGITERALRRRLARPEYAAQTQQVTRRTRTGTRTAAGLPPRLIEALKTDFANDPGVVGHIEQKTEERGSDAAQGGGTPLENAANVGALPAALYQKMLADKDAEIEYLRGQLDLAQKNLAREQTLRAMPALTGGEVADRSEERKSGDQEAETQTTEEKQGWWARFWKG